MVSFSPFLKRVLRLVFNISSKYFKRIVKFLPLIIFITIITSSVILAGYSILNQFSPEKTNSKQSRKTKRELSKQISDLENKLQFKTPCEMLKLSPGKYQKITIVRLLGPSLSPLQSPRQTSLNLIHTLKNEQDLKLSKRCIRSFWLVNCIINESELKLILSTLESYKEEFYLMPNCSENSAELFRQLMSVNNLRNRAIKLARKQKTDWILPLDGNIFIPRDALLKIVHNLVIASLVGSEIQVIPFFRAIQCQNTTFTNSFQFDRELSLSMLKYNRKFPTISEDLSRKQEGQIALSSDLKGVENFFSESYLYSKKSKMSLIEDLEEGNNTRVRCGHRAGTENHSETRAKVRQYVLSCGYAIRLLYWPENDKCQKTIKLPDHRNASMNLTGIIWASQKLMKRSEVNMEVRGRLRDISVMNLKNRLIKNER